MPDLLPTYPARNRAADGLPGSGEASGTWPASPTGCYTARSGEFSVSSGLSAQCRNSPPTPADTSRRGFTWTRSVPALGGQAAVPAVRAGGTRRVSPSVRLRRHRAREDRDLRCSSRPSTAPPATTPPTARTGDGTLVVSATGTRRSGSALNLTPARGLSARAGGRAGGSRTRNPRRHGPVPGPGARRGHRGL